MFDRQLSRRAFLRTGTAAVAAAVLPTGARADDKDPFAGFTVGVQSYTFRNFGLEKAVAKIAECGATAVEFFNRHVPVNSTPEQVKAVLKLCGDHGVKPVAFGVEAFSKNHDENKKKFEFASALGVQVLSADPARDAFDSLDKLCAEYKIAIGIHPHGPSGKGRHPWWSAEVILAAVKDHHELIGTTLDTGHLIRMAQLGEKLDPAQQVRVTGKRNFGMHLKDHDNKRKTDMVFGDPTGVLDIQAVLKALKEVGFKYVASIEYEANPSDPMADMTKNVAAIRAAQKGK